MFSHVRGLFSRVQHVLLSCLLPCPGPPCTGAYTFWDCLVSSIFILDLIFFNYFKYVIFFYYFETDWFPALLSYVFSHQTTESWNKPKYIVTQSSSNLKILQYLQFDLHYDFTKYKIQNWTSHIFLGSMSLNRLKMRHRPYQQSRYFRKA